MSRLLLAAGALVLGLAAWAAAAEPGPAPAKPRFVLVLGEKAADPEKFAAEFLAERLRRDLGAEATLGAAAPAGGEAQAVILGTPESNPALGKFKADLPKDAPEGFLITTDGGATVLVGGSPRAVVYAVSRLLTERGWRFYALHDLGEVPIDAKTAMPAGPIKDKPYCTARALVTDSLGDVLPRYLDWMVMSGLNRLAVRVDRTGLEAAAAAAKEVSRRGIGLELTAPEAWWKKQAGLKGDEKAEEASALVGAAMTKAVEKVAGAVAAGVSEKPGFFLVSPLGAPFAGPRGPLRAIELFFTVAGDKRDNVALEGSPRRFLLDEFNAAADYFALSAWKGPPPVEDFVRDYAKRYYGGGEAGEDVAAYLLGLEKLSAELAKPDALLDDATFAGWKALADRFRAAREKSKANSRPRKRLALYHKPVFDHYQTCAEAARLLRRAGAAAGDERRKMLLDVIKLCWDYNRRKEPRLFEYNPGDAFVFRDASGKSPELEGELVLLEKARALLLAGEDGKMPAGLVAAALAEGGGGKAGAVPLASDAPGNKAESFADGKAATATVLAPGPGGRFSFDLGREAEVGRVRFLAGPERPITGFRLRAADGSGAATTLAEGVLEAPEMFLVREITFPPAKARTLVLEVERYEPARQDPFGPALAELEAYER